MLGPPTDEERPHIAAIARAVQAGFRQIQLAACPVLFYERRREAVVETCSVEGITSAKAARWRIEDYQGRGGGPLWEISGTVADVIGELLALPRHGSRGAPSLARPRSSDLWVPGDV
jgi:hypothetical protein